MLRTNGITKTFGGVHALQGVTISAAPGEITGLIGPNGSGKSTLFDIITGVVVPDSGDVWFDDAPINDCDLRQIAHRGLSRTFQVPRFAKQMTVLENLMMVAPGSPGESVLRLFSPRWIGRIAEDERQRLSKAREMVKTLELEHVANNAAGSLSGGQAKLLALGMALMSDPRMVCLDEPVAGVNSRIIEVIVRLLRERCAAGLTVLLIEHNMSMLRELCNQVIALDLGQVISTGTPSDVQRDDRVIASYLGRSA